MYCFNKLKKLNNIDDETVEKLHLTVVSRRNGFTIVEMAMVLVVVGLILTMVISGINVLDEVRMRAEIAKIDKLRNATLTYVNLTNNMPPVKADGRVDIKIYLDKQLIDGIDIRSAMSATGRFHVVPCYALKDSVTMASAANYKPSLYLYRPPTSVGQGNVAYIKLTQLCVSYTDPTFTSGSEPLEAFPINVVCKYEMLVDDSNHLSGSGRQACLTGSPDNCGSLNDDINKQLLSAAGGSASNIPTLDYRKRDEAWEKGCRVTIPSRRQSYAVRIY